MDVRGSCHCGRITFQAVVDPERVAICHCNDCQQLTGTAYRVSVPVPRAAFTLLTGTPSIYVKVGGSGSRRAQAFCPNCGSPLYTHSADEAEPSTFGLRVGALAQRRQLPPRRQKWCASALPWAMDLGDLPQSPAE